VSRRIALNNLRRDRTLQRKLPLLIMAEDTQPTPPGGFPDDRLRLVFTCCHPALSAEAQVALTLRLICGVSTPDIARAFLVSEPAMAARITRAKKKIAAAHIPYAVPAAAELPGRLDAALTVVHLLYTTGHTAVSGADLIRDDLADRALDLARMLHQLLPAGREAAGLLALLLAHQARRDTRTDADGGLLRPAPVVLFNRAAALSMTEGPQAALAVVESLEDDGSLAGYHYLPATKADLLRRLGRPAEAAEAYQAALTLTSNRAEQEFLNRRMVMARRQASAR
jgi:predicted RNA polymerase sigma factor